MDDFERQEIPEEIMMTLHRFQREDHLCDLTLISSSGNQFVAHAGVLAAASSLLRNLLQECELGNYTIEMLLSDQEIRTLIDYAYTGNQTDPLMANLGDMGLHCYENDDLSHSHAAVTLSFLYQFAKKGLFCNMSCQNTGGDLEQDHTYMFLSRFTFLSEHISRQSLLLVIPRASSSNGA